jgi:hypothetical protein
MSFFKRRRKPLDSLVVDPSAAGVEVGPQDDVPGPNALDFEAIENRQAIQEAYREIPVGRFGRIQTEVDRFPDLKRDPAKDDD